LKIDVSITHSREQGADVVVVAEACNTMIRFNRSLSANCVTFGAHDEAPWIFNGTTERAELLIFLASYTLAKYSRPFSFVEMNWVNNFNEPFPNSTIYITRPSGYAIHL
jgi:hypothetical protein